ncbi:hypothetical protein [Quadrisphaera sp. INWT6]|uniref:hypothetical protein n=1 Tax=Quadrisphaera sp. INWT6 TaxID=2596917 RepID=UPI0018927102|nr:hypothetical protein [Quadrisphaera sp. INWT6]MBF5082400.1 hypothetical protein [Quadrisphaera sp. INWT6]
MSHLSLVLNLVHALTGDLRRQVAPGPDSADRGVSTLEVVVIALGLFLVAGVLVAAITTAINTRIAQIN